MILTLQKVGMAGLKPSYQAAAATGDLFENNGRVFLHVKNGSAAQKTVTVICAKPCSYGYHHDVVVDVPAGEERLIGPFDPERFNSPSRQAEVTYSAVDQLTVAAIEA